MGRNVADIEMLAHIPRSVQERGGNVVGVYFPVSRRLRLNSGEFGDVNASGIARMANGTLIRVDLPNMVLDYMHE